MKKLFVLIAAIMMMGLNSLQAQAPAQKTTHVTKSGAPDKRYKENKQPKATKAAPTKKDGTPDMRYKANKPAKPAAVPQAN